MPQCRIVAALRQFKSSDFLRVYVKHLSQNLAHYRAPVCRRISALSETGLSAIRRKRMPGRPPIQPRVQVSAKGQRFTPFGQRESDLTNEPCEFRPHPDFGVPRKKNPAEAGSAIGPRL